MLYTSNRIGGSNPPLSAFAGRTRRCATLFCLAAIVVSGFSKDDVAAIAATRAAAATEDSTFRFDGPHPIHPMCVIPLVGDLADERPSVAAIDLEGSTNQKCNRPEVRSGGGTVEAQDGVGGFAAYRLVGTTPGGLHVLIVMVNGGGSGVFEDVVWVRLTRDRVFDGHATRDRTMLVKVGSFTLGDRDDGDVRLDGRTLFVGRSKYRGRDTTIDLD